jgi:hypothetical protein
MDIFFFFWQVPGFMIAWWTTFTSLLIAFPNIRLSEIGFGGGADLVRLSALSSWQSRSLDSSFLGLGFGFGFGFCSCLSK